MPLAAKLCVGPTKVLELWERILDVIYHTFTDAKFGGYRNSAAAGAAKNVEFLCVFVRHAFERQSFFVRPISP